MLQMNAHATASCTVLLCTLNGAKFLDTQLQSLAQQTLRKINIFVSDDGSTDDTHRILGKWSAIWSKGDFVIRNGPRRGFAENFRSLILKEVKADYVAFCDQDDIWDPNKLEVAIKVLSATPNVPALYGGRSVLVDEQGKRIKMSPLFRRIPSFGNALVQSLAAGNTMVMNIMGFKVLQESSQRTHFLMHDWWAYLIISGVGGYVHYSHVPHIQYRQHATNALGGGISLFERPRRFLELCSGKYVKWNEENLDALDKCKDMLDANSTRLLDDFKIIRNSNSIIAVNRLINCTIRRQTVKGDIALVLAAFFRRL